MFCMLGLSVGLVPVGSTTGSYLNCEAKSSPLRACPGGSTIDCSKAE